MFVLLHNFNLLGQGSKCRKQKYDTVSYPLSESLVPKDFRILDNFGVENTYTVCFYKA